jgi:hypothetical protein
MEVQDGGSLSITELGKDNGGEPRKTVAAGTYEAEYRGMKIQMEDMTKWGYGIKKMVRLLFKITKGPFKDSITSCKKSMFKTNDGNWVVGSKSELAEVIRTITNGTGELNDSFKGKKYLIKVINKKGKKADPETGAFKVYDSIETVINMAVSGDEEAPVVTQPAAPVARVATPVVAAPVAAATPAGGAGPKAVASPSDGLLNDLTELSDFEKF